MTQLTTNAWDPDIAELATEAHALLTSPPSQHDTFDPWKTRLMSLWSKTHQGQDLHPMLKVLVPGELLSPLMSAFHYIGWETPKEAGQHAVENALPRLRTIAEALTAAEARLRSRAEKAAAASAPALPASPVHGYELLEEIGKGAHGLVHRARTLKEPIIERAIKILRPMPFGGPKDPRPRFNREVASLSKLSHRGVVTYVDAGFTNEDEPAPYLVMALIEGTPLRDSVPELSAKQLVKMFCEVLDALQYIHDQRIIHRDVKPSNIIVRKSDRQPILLDLSLAFLYEEFIGQTITAQTAGTPGYIAPETIQDVKMSRRPTHDVYASGITLYELLGRRLPNVQDYAPLHSLSADLVGLDEIIQRAISPLSTRYSRVSDLAADLQGWLAADRQAVGQPEDLGALRSEIGDHICQHWKRQGGTFTVPNIRAHLKNGSLNATVRRATDEQVTRALLQLEREGAFRLEPPPAGERLAPITLTHAINHPDRGCLYRVIAPRPAQ